MCPCLLPSTSLPPFSARAHPAPSFLLTHCLILPPAPVNLFLFSLLPAHLPLQPQLCFLPPMQIPPSGFPPNFYPSPSVFLHSYSSLNPVPFLQLTLYYSSSSIHPSLLYLQSLSHLTSPRTLAAPSSFIVSILSGPSCELLYIPFYTLPIYLI